ncbi:MAG: hypothetical protein CMJ94_08040 [Planctomycetes bacterium]|nr:hypothetical protein [Planctomycetota bacterium]
MIRPLSWIALGTFALSLVSCRPDAYSYESNTSGEEQESLESNGPGLPGGTLLSEMPQIVAPYEALLKMRSEVHIYDQGTLAQALREDLYADGAGQFALLLDSISDGSGVWTVASQAEKFQHHQRQFFLAKYRGPVVRDNALASRNYDWYSVPGSYSVAGIPVNRYHLDSKYHIGDIVLDVDASTEVLLGWTIEDPDGVPILSSYATTVDYSPALSGVEWATANVDTEVYDGSGAAGQLGFDPLVIESTGAGFLNRDEKLLHAQTLFAGRSNMLLTLMSDGVRSVAIAQEYRGPAQKVGDTPVKALTLFESVDTGVTLIEGQIHNHWVYSIGPVPSGDLVLFLESMKV